MADIKPPFTAESAHKKVKAAQALWSTRDPSKIALAYSTNSIWRNRVTFLTGREDIVKFLTKKWQKERSYRLRKELFAFSGNKIAVQFWYEFKDAEDDMKWKRCYGLEDWTFDTDGKMAKRMMSGNDMTLEEGERFFVDGVDVDNADISEKHCLSNGAGAQPAVGRQENITSSPEHPAYYTSPTHADLRAPGHVHGDPPARGRGPAIPSGSPLMIPSQSQVSGRAQSPRIPLSNGESSARSTPAGTGGLERNPSINYGHHRQTSIVHGVAQHSRNSSISSSPAYSHRSPQVLVTGSLQNGFSPETPRSFNTLSPDSGGFHPIISPIGAADGSQLLFHSPPPLTGESDGFRAHANSFAQRRDDRAPVGKSRREHGRSSSKPHLDQTSAGEYALHHLFNSFIGKANFKIDECVATIGDKEPRIEDVCGPGVDNDFDQLISALGHIARQKPKPLIDSIMFWRQKKGEDANAAQDEMNMVRNLSPPQRPLQRRVTEPSNSLHLDSGHSTAGFEETHSMAYPALVENWRQALRRLTLSNYLLCRVLIEIYHQSDVKTISRWKLEELIFDQLQRLDPERVGASPLLRSNCTIYGQLLGVMSASNFQVVSHRFITILQNLEDGHSKVMASKETEGRVEILVLAMKYLSIKVQSDSAWKESCDFIYTLGKFFVNSHGQIIKHAYCQALEILILPIAGAAGSQLGVPKWKEFLNLLNTRLTQMLVKPRHWSEAFPLSTLLLCTSPAEVLSAQWLSVVTTLQAKLKDRITRTCALQAICRLTWSYLHRTTEPVPTILRKLEDVVKIVLPTGKKTYLTTDPAFTEPIIELIRIIGFHNHDFCFRVIVFPLINSDMMTSSRDPKIEQLEPERMVIGIRGFLAVLAGLENAGQGGLPFPRFSTEHGGHKNSQLNSPLVPFRQAREVRTRSIKEEDRLSRAVVLSKLDDTTKDYYGRFCEILGRITTICDLAFGGQAVLDEKFGGQIPKTPMSDSFTFSRRDEHFVSPDHKQGFYELLHVAIQALPRCLSSHTPFNPLINLLCTGTAHVQSNIATSAAKSLRAIARQLHAQQVTIGFARFIFSYDIRYSTMSDEGLLGSGHIDNTLQLYLELLQIWIEEIRQKAKSAAIESPHDGSSATRGLQLDLTSVSALVDEVESHGLFFLCSQSRRVRSFAVRVLRLVTEFDTALGRDHPRIIQILDGALEKIIDPNDSQLSVAERSRLQKEKRKSSVENTLIEICSSNVSYDSTLWFKIFPNLIRLSFERCPFAVTLGRDSVCARLLQMHDLITLLSEGTRGPQPTPFDRAIVRLGSTPPDVVIEQWKLYLVMACSTLTNAGAQTQSQLANTQHARSKSKGPQQGQEKISSARALFSYIIPLLSAGPGAIRDAIVTALGSININLYRTLLESLQYAVTTCNEAAKLRVGFHHRSGSDSRKNRRTDRLRTEVTHVYKLSSRFLHEEEVLRDEWVVNNLIKYTDDMRVFLSDTNIQNDWEFQTLRRHYCGLVEEVFEGVNRTKDPSRWMSFEARKAAFALMEDWCGYSPDQTQASLREDNMRQFAIDQHRQTGDNNNTTAIMEIEKRNLRTAALSAMASLCGGPISVTTDRGRGTILSFDVRRMLRWIDQIFGTINDKIHLIGRRALKNLIVYNRTFPMLLEHSIDRCYAAERPKALESYFEVITQVLTEHQDYPLAFWRILGAVLFTLGLDNSQIRSKSARLLRVMEQRQQKSSKLQDFDVSVSDKTTAVYKLAQFEISRRLAKQHSDLAFFVFSQFSQHYKNIHADHQRNMIAAILPWVQIIELQLDPNGGLTPQTYMLLANLLEITTKTSTALHNEVQALWQALATGPHGGNVQVVLDFVISLCIDRSEQSFVDYAKQIVVFLSSTLAGQKVVEFLLMQITPRNMVHTEKPKPMEISPDVLGLPYVADLGEALPIGNKQSGFSLGQLSLILLVDLMVAPVKLSKDSVPLLLQVCIVLWDHYTLIVQEQAREMLVHLIHELVISKIEDNTTTPKKERIEQFIEAIRQSKPSVIWTYQESNGKNKEDEGSRVPSSMTHVTKEVIKMFALTHSNIHEQWAKVTLAWATSCSVRHLACRSFQIFRCILASLDQPMLADMLARLSNTIADEAPEVQTFSMEILATLKIIIGALEPADVIKYPQLYWVTSACLNTVNECEFIEALSMLETLLNRVNLEDPAVIKLLLEAKPGRWQGAFDGVMTLVYKGLKSDVSLHKTLSIIIKGVTLPNTDLIGDQSRLLLGVLAHLPCFLRTFDVTAPDPTTIEAALILVHEGQARDYHEISMILNAFINSRYASSKDFLVQIISALRQSFFPAMESKCVVFLMGLLTNRLSWYKLKTMEILCVILPDINMRNPDIACHGPDLISPLLRLLQTEYCPQALEVMDNIVAMSATPMERHHIRMSMALPGSRTIRKEYERTISLYGIPEETGWSIPMPAIHSKITRDNVHAVFYTCANSNTNANPTEASSAATPEIEFDAEYFPTDTSATLMSEDSRAEHGLDHSLLEGNMGDLMSKLDSLDDFFDDAADDKYLDRFSEITITGYSTGPDNGAHIYDEQTAPILRKSLTRTASATSLHNSFADPREGFPNPDVMTPAAFTTVPHAPLPNPPLPTGPLSTQQQLRPSLHARSVTSPANTFLRPRGDVSAGPSDDDVDEFSFSDDERSTSTSRVPMFEAIVRRSKSSARKPLTGTAGRELRQGDLLRGQGRARSKSQAPNSPEVPKVPEAYLNASRTGSDG